MNQRIYRARSTGTAALALLSATWLFGAGGCASTQSIAVRADRYQVDVRLVPSTHRITGRAILDLTRTKEEAPGQGQWAAVDLQLHPSLRIRQVSTRGTRMKRWTTTRSSAPEAKSICRITLEQPARAFTVVVDYEGELHQDVAAGEKPGEIHNFTMKAHIGDDGIYLADGHWYPQPAAEDKDDPYLSDFTLVADPVPGFELVAGAERDRGLSEQSGRFAWRTPYPVERLVLVGGRHEVHRAVRRGIEISVHLKPSQAEHASGLIEAVRRNLDRYEPLLGPYPAKEYAIVDNFFSSGFAFPCFTLLSSAVIDMGERSRTAHGYLDHEMLHCWWGNGVHVDPRDGNWCEALASYGANYYGYVLDGNEEEARRQRRNYSHFLSRMKPEKDKPLGTFGREEGADRSIGYQKGAAVFHMLAQRMGQDRFWSAMRRFNEEFLGRYASWEELRSLCEQESGLSLENFFRQWVRGGGAPTVTLRRARFDPAARSLAVFVTQDESAFDLIVPLRVTHAEGTLDLSVPLRESAVDFSQPVDVIPLTVELDPDYQLFRKIPLEEAIPTTAATRRGDSFACVLPRGEVLEPYRLLRETFESSFKEHERVLFVVGDIPDGALAYRCALILGDAARDAYVSGFLGAIEFPVRWTPDGFVFEQTAYADPGDAVLCTVAHPGVPGGGVTVVYANGESAIPKAMNVPMYDRSLVIFRNGVPVLRRDFERRQVIRVEPISATE